MLKQQKFIVIPLGYNCALTCYLRNSGLRLASFPLDWVITQRENFDNLIRLIKNDFIGLVDFSKLWVAEINGTETIYHTDYKIGLPHIIKSTEGWKNTFKGFRGETENSALELIQAEQNYEKKRQRFMEVMRLGVPIYFMRLDIAEDQAIRLYQTFKQKFPNTDFRLICFNEYDNFQWDKHPYICNYYLGGKLTFDKIFNNECYCLDAICEKLGFFE